ncbi:MAG: tyrosine-type recombinase/integrase [Haemophilus parainfluenzae]|jgi:hypothetical protein|uniref:tyrosine-type recombinase/integrase n=1 Tax=Haemophilus parainfluenzae TaxID=729 RepID=UPI0018A55E99|nr:integrase arm-type DNA-binding domain-containing protein [Haemophilus parainfluenzae]QOR21822.1 integrase arm-type DNA-binding domain-containing protein [Haemophilus parainfluenzae]
MARNYLTDTKINKFKPKAKEYSKADGDHLYILIKPNGKKKWLFIYKHPVTKTRPKRCLGDYPAISLSRIRDIIRPYNSLLAEGIDPFERIEQEEAAAQKLKVTVREMLEHWKEWKAREVKPSTLKDALNRINRWIMPTFGDVTLADIKARNVSELISLIYETKKDTARKVAGYFVEIMERAVKLEFIEYNPLLGIRSDFKKQPATHRKSIDYKELPDFFYKMRLSGILPLTKLLIEWQILTMVRPAEAVMAEWSEIDLKNKLWTIPAYKMKGGKRSHCVPLSSQSLRLLEEIKKHSFNSPFLFPSRCSSSKHLSKETANKGINNKDLYVGKATAHGMRATARTYFADKLIDYFVSEACLSHRVGSRVSLAYNRTDYLEERKKVMQHWGDYIEECKRDSI